MNANLCGWGSKAGSLRAREPSPARPGWAQSFPSYLHVQFWKVKVEILWFGKNIISSRAALRTLMKPHQSVSRDGETIFLNPDRISHMRSLWLMKVLNVSFNLNQVPDDIPILMWVHILGQMNSDTGAIRTGGPEEVLEKHLFLSIVDHIFIGSWYRCGGRHGIILLKDPSYCGRIQIRSNWSSIPGFCPRIGPSVQAGSRPPGMPRCDWPSRLLI